MKFVWLIDVGYITRASRGRGKVDYVKTRAFLEKRYNATGNALIFNGVDKRYGIDLGLKQFYYNMETSGFGVKLYEMEGGAQKQVDVAIASYIVYYAMQGYRIVLSSGDRDFVPALLLATEQGAAVTLMTYDLGVHGDLMALSGEILHFEDFPEVLR
ncbi:NYN domain-containing protein [Dawidia soli]|uniref:NYN domain-containing protein n=1 Tax=Dawidia soli TaxID=2782352 RepID=A0AAP2GDS2_9BACT|nr:NYN domain-containing protein [Dawidia soli]MBT1687619.1 NYN domain-containing protein [Dawidia soli]